MISKKSPLVFFLLFAVCFVCLECSISLHERPSLNALQLCLYTRTNRDDCYHLALDNIKRSPYDNRKHTVLFIHGLNEHYNDKLSQNLKNEYINYGDFNVILANGQSFAPQLSSPSFQIVRPYDQTNDYFYNVRSQLISEFINALVYQNLLNLNQFHIVKNDFGSHVADILANRYGNGIINQIGAPHPALRIYKNIFNNRFNQYSNLIHYPGNPVYSRFGLSGNLNSQPCDRTGCPCNDAFCRLFTTFFRRFSNGYGNPFSTVNEREPDSDSDDHTRSDGSNSQNSQTQHSKPNSNTNNNQSNNNSSNNGSQQQQNQNTNSQNTTNQSNGNPSSSSLTPNYFGLSGKTTEEILRSLRASNQWPFAIYLP